MFNLYFTLRGEFFDPQLLVELLEEDNPCRLVPLNSLSNSDRTYGQAHFEPKVQPEHNYHETLLTLFQSLDQLWLADEFDEIEEIVLHLIHGYENQCNLEFPPEILGKMDQYQVTLCVSAYQIETKT
jgi:hypothetical protein